MDGQGAPRCPRARREGTAHHGRGPGTRAGAPRTGRERSGSRRPWSVFGLALGVYVVAVTSRTSFAVAVPLAGDRLTGVASVLALFVVLQLTVYALAQVPVGLLLDRFGSRRVLVAGALVVCAGQLVLAMAASLPVAIAGRVLVGAGDATAFIGVVRLLPAWFPLRRVPMTQLTSIIGQTGQVISAVPFLALLHSAGWAPAFTFLGGLGALMAAAALIVVRDRPEGEGGAPATGHERVRATLGAVLRQPGTWLGFFIHWTGVFPASVLTLMWGLSWMTEGLGLERATASALLSLNAGVGVLTGLVAGMLSARLPAHRSSLSLASGALALAAWAAGLLAAHTGRVTAAALCVCLVTGAVAPFSSIGLDAARSLNAPERWGTVAGVVNMGGFTATILAVQVVGLVLDLSGGRGGRDFLVAFMWLAPVWAVGMTGVLVARIATRRRMRRTGAVASF